MEIRMMPMRNEEATKIIEKALTHGQSALKEYDAKRFLSCFGIPVNHEAIAHSIDSAASQAEKIGFPVVLKACGPRLFHKTEVGGVVLNLRTADQVREAGKRLLKIDGCQELLVQEMISGDRELVCGFTRDEKFGPCVMFGFGGIFTELINDAVFRMAPLKTGDVLEMVRELRTQKLTESFRGQAAVDLDMLSKVLVALGEIALQFEKVFQIDINPLKSRPDGRLFAVDALVMLQDRPGEISKQPAKQKPYVGADFKKKEDFTPFFEPESVVIVGASAVPGKPGHEVIRNIQANEYKGKLYLVNPKAGEILGLPVHSSIESLPGKPDLAVIILPAAICPQALRDCVAKGIKHAVISAGGFAEVDDSGAQTQQELIEIIRESGIRIIGPNTAGHTSTPHDFTSTFFPLVRIRRGRVSYLTQTGNFCTHTMKYILTAEHFGVSRVIGLGNAIDIDESEALE